MLRNLIYRLLYRLKANYTTEDLIKKGLRVGGNFQRMHDVILDPSHCWLIEIGNNVTIAPRVHVLAHDASTKMLLGYTKIGLVSIGNNVFIGANTVILPNVTIGNNIVIGANSTVSKNLPDNGVYAGIPAKYICSIEEYKQKNLELFESSPKYGKEYTLNGGINNRMKDDMRTGLHHKIGFIE